MAKQGSVRLSGRFKPGTQVRLVKVRDETVLRSEGGQEVGTAKVDKDGTVEFSKGVEDGARYFATGYVDGTYLEVRLRGRSDSDDNVNAQAPVGPDRVKLSDGTFVDEPPEQHQKTPGREVGPAPGQHQVPKGVVQRSDTPRGTAHPVDPGEQAPYRRQEDVPDGVVQASSTETGRATEIVKSFQRQEDTPPGLLQRSDTPHGVATPIPAGDAVQAQLVKESAAAKETRGEPGRAAAEPLGTAPRVKGAGTASGSPVSPGAPNDRDVTSGHDAMGQPIYADVAASVGLEPAKKVLGDRSVDDAKDAKVAGDPLERLDDPPQDAGKSETEEATTGAGQARPSEKPTVEKLAAKPRRKSSRSRTASKSTKAKEK